MESGGEWGNEVRADIGSGRVINSQFQGKGAHPLMSGRQNGLARGIYRVSADGCFSGRAIPNEVRFCSNAISNNRGFSAYWTFSGSKSAHLWQGDDSGADFAHCSLPASGHFVRQRNLRAMAQEADLKEMANSKLRW